MPSTTLTDMQEWLSQQEVKVHGNYINGEWKESTSGNTFSICNSAQRDQVLGFFQDSNEEDVNEAVEAAAEAFQGWSQVPGPDRGAVLYRFADLLEENATELAYILSAEQGKALTEAKGEVMRAAKEARFGAGEAFRIEGNTLPGERSNVWSSTIRKPLGVVAAIAPWNFPVVTPVRKIAPALAYGCTVVYKPASVTPWTSVVLMELLAKAGVPNGVVNLVVGSGSRVGNPLVKHPLVKGISFTGSSSLGKNINEIAAGRLAKTQLELGGKNPAVVLDYKDAENVAKQIVSAAFACSGQRCTSISRVIVTKENKAELTEALVKEMKNAKVGPAWEEGVTVGPLINEQHLDSVREYLEIASAEGARVVYGGETLSEGAYGQGAYIVPALLDQVTPEMRVAKEEIFGPVLVVLEVEDKEEALRVANNVEYGLAASIFTNDLTTAYQFADRVETGMVHVNHGTASAAHMPFGGVKQSGAGAFSIGKSNVEFFTELKSVYFQY
ncbi:aldehyde dehydrogenase family protein [Sediminibacillus massiliensis]|uniref:aldehyde dehydrogenase family protein n=1 Tax=Sediminibacillus massiliensis TaxID=1926277 RepID=UPI0009885CA4|nr:aldehyde dehydrogenase family protein [Sediminibacillus massiliensis]